jgi:mannitol operon repressor
MAPDDLRTKYPHLKKFWPYIDLLSKESPRGKVLISTGFIEQQLKEVLLAFMLPVSQAKNLLDGLNAPLGTFSSRISACYSLGLIKDHEQHDLSIIRHIRNDFAHNIHTSFETPSVVDRCGKLKTKAPDYTSEKMGEVELGPQEQFESAVVALILNLVNRPHFVGKQACLAHDWPY